MTESGRVPRLGVGPWRALTLLGLLLAGLAVVTSQGWDDPTNTALDPPYQPPPLAAVIPGTEEMSAMYADALVPDEAGPPANRLFLSESLFAADIRNATIGQAWHETWLEPHAGVIGVQVDVLEYRQAATALTAEPDCAPQTPLDVAVSPDDAISIAGLTASTPDLTAGCLFVLLGRQTITVQVATLGADHGARTEQFLRSYAATHLGWMTTSPDEPSPAVTFSSTRLALLRSWVVAVLLTALIAVIPSTLLDRATWSRLASRVRRRRRNPWQTDIDPWSSGILARAHAVGVWRFTAFLWTLRAGEIFWWSGWVTTGALVVAFLVGVLAQRRIMAGTLRFHRTRVFRGASLVAVTVGVVIAAGVLASAAYLWLLGVDASPVAPLVDGPEWATQRTALLYEAVAVVLFVLTTVPIALGRRVGMRLLSRRPPASGRPPVLLLRPFNDDRLRMRARRLDRASIVDQLIMRRWESFEEIEASALAKHGPLVAIMDNRGGLPPGLGAVREKCSNEEWRGRVSELCEASAFIALNVGRSQGVFEELQRVANAGYLHKTIFLIPPVRAPERRLRLAVLSAETRTSWAFFDTERTGRSVLAVCFPLGADRPTVVVGRGPDDVDYDVAIEQCVTALNLADQCLTAELDRLQMASVTVSTTDLRPRPVNGAAAPGAAVRPAEAPYVPGPPPPVVRIPDNRNGQPKKWVGKVWAWVLGINLIAIPYLIPLFFTGDPIGERDAKTTLTLNNQYHVSSIVSASADDAIVILNDQWVARADFTSESFEPIGSVDRYSEFFHRDGTVMYTVAPFDGGIAAVDLTTGSTMWSTTLTGGQRGLIVTDGRLVVADPAGRQLIVLDASTGLVDRDVPLDCRPWDLTSTPGSVFVNCPDLSTVLQLSGDSLSEAARFTVPTGVTTVFPCADTVCAQTNWEHRLVSIDQGPSDVDIRVRIADPLVAATGPIVAAEGYERVSVFDFAGNRVIRRVTDGTLTALAVSDDGRALYAQDNRLVRINK